MRRKEQFRAFGEIIFSNFKEIPWPCYLKPFENELFSSWLTRTARNHLVRFYSFCSSNFSGSEFWNRDLDRSLPDLIKAKITSKCVLDPIDIDRMLLNSYCPNIFLLPVESKSFWLTQFNFYKSNRKHNFGLAVCPSCLKNNAGNAYYDKSWRLALTTVCVNCETELIDRCPNCNSSINFLLAERGNKFKAPIFPLTCCWKCLFDLGEAGAKRASTDWINTQAVINGYIKLGYALDRQLNYSHLYFDVLKKILSLLNKKKSPKLIKMQELICEETGLEFDPPLDNREHTFNSLPVRLRGNLIQKAFWLLEKWPERFRRVTAKCNLKSKLFLDDFTDCPYWFESELRLNNRLMHAEWRVSYSDFSYGSFNEMASWQVSKNKNKKAIATNVVKE